ncbi:MAG: O-antigen ligase family protein [Candidatus Doudnabacteria bacterium]
MVYLFASLILLAPLYIWRFSIFGIPSNFLMVWSVLVALWLTFKIVWGGEMGLFLRKLNELPLMIKLATGGFILASLVSLFVNGLDGAKLAQGLVLVWLPIYLAALLYFWTVKRQITQPQILLWAAVIILGVAGIVSLAQYFWLIGLPIEFWGNVDEPKRAVGLFIHPNNYALFVTPLLAYLLPSFVTKIQEFLHKWQWPDVIFVLLWVLGAVGLFLSLSRGGWFGLAGAIAVYALTSQLPKIKTLFLFFMVAIIILVIATPNLRYRVILPFMGEKSSVARLSLWDTGWKMIKDSPVLGQGINGFNYQWDNFNTDPNLDHYNFAHNIVINFWVDYGLLGALSFMALLAAMLYFSWQRRKSDYWYGMMLFLIALVIHGLIDIPYLKNDLALVFWLFMALTLAAYSDKQKLKIDPQTGTI